MPKSLPMPAASPVNKSETEFSKPVSRLQLQNNIKEVITVPTTHGNHAPRGIFCMVAIVSIKQGPTEYYMPKKRDPIHQIRYKITARTGDEIPRRRRLPLQGEWL